MKQLVLKKPLIYFPKMGIKLKTTANQMQKREASERKHTQQSFIFHLLFLCTILFCACSGGKPDYDFKDSKDAISAYSDYLKCMKALPQCSTKELEDCINNWHELSDTVYKYIRKDPYYSAHTDLKTEFFLLTDSVRAEILRLACSEPKTMKDVALLKMHTSPYRDNKELATVQKEAEAFFAGLDKQPPYKTGTPAELLRQYSNFLEVSKSQEISDKQQLLKYLEIEDRHFRTFLSHISDYSNMGLGSITKNTEIICSQIFRSASNGQLESGYTMVYMSMRTDRRLLQNAAVCNDILKAKKVKEGLKVNAFLWMVIQPYLSMDSFSITMMTEKQTKQYMSIAENYSQLIDNLAAVGLVDKETAQQLPMQITRLYISSL